MGGVKFMVYYSCHLGQSLFEFVAHDWLTVLGLQYEDHVLEFVKFEAICVFEMV